MNAKIFWLIFWIFYAIMFSYSYGHSYQNSGYTYRAQAGVSALIAGTFWPVYWLSVAGTNFHKK